MHGFMHGFGKFSNFAVSYKFIVKTFDFVVNRIIVSDLPAKVGRFFVKASL